MSTERFCEVQLPVTPEPQLGPPSEVKSQPLKQPQLPPTGPRVPPVHPEPPPGVVLQSTVKV